VEQVENRVSGTENKVEKFDQMVKDHERTLKKIRMEHARYVGHHEKTKPMNHG
jgi:hypothetical protein